MSTVPGPVQNDIMSEMLNLVYNRNNNSELRRTVEEANFGHISQKNAN